tara:strand:- start:102 stop:1112 length:1011 start_codon:yes stop_codon:yes gene_type:complete
MAGGIIIMPSFRQRVKNVVRPTRYAYNNSKFSRQLSFPYSGGNKLLGAFLIPPGHTMVSMRNHLTLIGKDTVDDDLQGSIGSVILALPADYYPDGGSTDWSTLDSMSNMEDWVQKRLPYVALSKAYTDQNYVSLFQMMSDLTTPGDANFKLGPGQLVLNGYDQKYDDSKVIWVRQKQTHPIFGTGMMVGSSSVADGGAYTPIDHVDSTIKQNVHAGSVPTVVACMVFMPDHEDATNSEDVFPDLDANNDTYEEWIKAHDPYYAKAGFDSDINFVGGKAQAAYQYLSVNYTEENTDQGIPEESSESKWNCTWRFSAQIKPPAETAPGNITVSNIKRS